MAYRDTVDNTIRLRNDFETLIARVRSRLTISMHHAPTITLIATLLCTDSADTPFVGKWAFRIVTFTLITLFQKRCLDMQKHFRELLRYKVRIVDKNFDNSAESEFVASALLNLDHLKKEDVTIIISLFVVALELLGKASQGENLLTYMGAEIALFTCFMACIGYSIKVREQFNTAMIEVAKQVGPEAQMSGVRITKENGDRVDLADNDPVIVAAQKKRQ